VRSAGLRHLSMGLSLGQLTRPWLQVVIYIFIYIYILYIYYTYTEHRCSLAQVLLDTSVWSGLSPSGRPRLTHFGSGVKWKLPRILEILDHIIDSIENRNSHAFYPHSMLLLF
jgi:hypothetical protein